MEDIQKQVEELNETPKSLTTDEIRNQVTEKFGLSEDEHSDLIDELVQDKIVEHKKFSTAITQKINWRTKAQELGNVKMPETVVPAPAVAPKETVFDENKVIEVLEKRDLDALDLSDSTTTQRPRRTSQAKQRVGSTSSGFHHGARAECNHPSKSHRNISDVPIRSVPNA